MGKVECLSSCVQRGRCEGRENKGEQGKREGTDGLWRPRRWWPFGEELRHIHGPRATAKRTLLYVVDIYSKAYDRFLFVHNDVSALYASLRLSEPYVENIAWETTAALPHCSGITLNSMHGTPPRDRWMT